MLNHELSEFMKLFASLWHVLRGYCMWYVYLYYYLNRYSPVVSPWTEITDKNLSPRFTCAPSKREGSSLLHNVGINPHRSYNVSGSNGPQMAETSSNNTMKHHEISKQNTTPQRSMYHTSIIQVLWIGGKYWCTVALFLKFWGATTTWRVYSNTAITITRYAETNLNIHLDTCLHIISATRATMYYNKLN